MPHGSSQRCYAALAFTVTILVALTRFVFRGAHADSNRNLGSRACTFYESLRASIVNGEFPPGARLASYIELAHTFGVSTITVQWALTHLEEEGLIVREPGSSMLVCAQKANGNSGKKSEEALAPPRHRVLVVEDDTGVADSVSMVLESEGHEIQTVDGPRAMESALTFRPDVVLLDLMMPTVDGFQVAAMLAANDQTKDIPVIVMTALRGAESVRDRLHAAAFLPKPFDIEQLLHYLEIATALVA